MPRWEIADSQFEEMQKFLLSRNLLRLTSNDQGFGAELLTNYLLITDGVSQNPFDSGLIRTDLTPRPAWTDVWQPYPGRL